MLHYIEVEQIKFLLFHGCWSHEIKISWGRMNKISKFKQISTGNARLLTCFVFAALTGLDIAIE